MGVRRFIKGRRRLFRKKENLHGGAHGVEEVDDDEGEDGQPLLPCEGGKRRHSCVLLLNGLKIKDVAKQFDSPCLRSWQISADSNLCPLNLENNIKHTF